MRKFAYAVLMAAFVSSLLGCSSGEDPYVYRYGESEMYEKFWDSEVIHNETICLIEDDTGVASGSLFYEPDKIISVRDYTLKNEYVEGTDYSVSGNKIVRLDGSSMPYFTEANVKGEDLPEDYGLSTYNAKEGKIVFTEGAGIVMHQIAVTYSHKDSWSYDVPKYLGGNLPNTEKALKEGGDLQIVFYGDSIMTGCNASAKLGIEPFQDIYPDAVTSLLKERHPNTNITMVNTSYGGWMSKDGVTNIDNCVNAYEPDLVFLGFGMNDGSNGVQTIDYVDNMEFMIKSIRARKPTAEVVVVSTILANPDSIQNAGQEDYLPDLKTMVDGFGLGVALLDMTTYSKAFNERKRSLDIYANNINHPSDFLARQYVTNILTALDEDF
jgi:lysophospholipase L1-like esterase